MAKANVDLSEFYRLSRPKKPPCQIGFAITKLEEEEAERLEAACATDKGVITAGAIREWLARRKHEVSQSAVVSHRARNCTCYEQS